MHALNKVVEGAWCYCVSISIQSHIVTQKNLKTSYTISLEYVIGKKGHTQLV